MPKQTRFTRRQPSTRASPAICKTSLTHKLSNLALRPTISFLKLRNRIIERTMSGPNLGQHLDRPDVTIEPFEFTPIHTNDMEADTDTETYTTDTTDTASDSDSSMSSSDCDLAYGVCCFCALPCNICSQACGRCMRAGTFISDSP